MVRGISPAHERVATSKLQAVSTRTYHTHTHFGQKWPTQHPPTPTFSQTTANDHKWSIAMHLGWHLSTFRAGGRTYTCPHPFSSPQNAPQGGGKGEKQPHPTTNVNETSQTVSFDSYLIATLSKVKLTYSKWLPLDRSCAPVPERPHKRLRGVRHQYLWY